MREPVKQPPDMELLHLNALHSGNKHLVGRCRVLKEGMIVKVSMD
jgi:hypothetical protein